MNIIKKLQEFKISGVGALMVGVIVFYFANHREPEVEQPKTVAAVSAEPFLKGAPGPSATSPVPKVSEVKKVEPFWYVDNKVDEITGTRIGSACIYANENPIQLCFRPDRDDILLTTPDTPARNIYNESVAEFKFISKKDGVATSRKYVATVATNFQSGMGITSPDDTTELTDLLLSSKSVTVRVSLASGAKATVHFAIPASDAVAYQ